MSIREEFTLPIQLLVPIKDIGEAGVSGTITLNEDQKAFFIDDLDLSAFDAFLCEWELKPLHKNRYCLKACIKAEVTQLSSLSLKPVKCDIDESFKTEFWPIEQNDPVRSPELEIDYVDEIIEFYESDVFDIGQLIYENFIISIEQYPRNEGEVFDWQSEEITENEKPNPFAALKVLKNGQE